MAAQMRLTAAACGRCASPRHPDRECSTPDPLVRRCGSCGREKLVHGSRRGREPFRCVYCRNGEEER